MMVDADMERLAACERSPPAGTRRPFLTIRWDRAVCRILVSGSTEFVGGWLTPELEQAGHQVVGMPLPGVLDIADAPAVRDLVAAVRPEAVVHLAGVAYAPDASADATKALRVNVGGTLAMLEACRREMPGIAVLVVGSAEVYGAPDGENRSPRRATLFRAASTA